MKQTNKSPEKICVEELHDATYKGDMVKACTLLKNHPSIVNARGNFNSTPLHWAALKGHMDMVDMLLSFGADIDTTDDSLRTPLYLAALGSHAVAAKLLIDKGADISASDHVGQTALHQAASHHCDKIVRFLLAHGADVNVRDNNGKTPLSLAMSSVCLDYTEVEDILRQHGGIV